MKKTSATSKNNSLADFAKQTRPRKSKGNAEPAAGENKELASTPVDPAALPVLGGGERAAGRGDATTTLAEDNADRGNSVLTANKAQELLQEEERLRQQQLEQAAAAADGNATRIL